MQRFDLVKQSMYDSTTVFYPESLLQVPKKCDFIPIEDTTVLQSVNNALDQVEQFRTLLRENIHKLKNESLSYKKKLDELQFKVSQASELLDGKNLSRAKMLLKVDCEFLRRTLPLKKTIPNQEDDTSTCHRELYKESVDALKTIIAGGNNRGAQLQSSGYFNDYADYLIPPSINQSNRYNASGFRSNEIDEGTELKKLTDLNAILCHQEMIESIENTQLKLQQIGLHSY